MTDAKIIFSSEDSLLVEFEQKICEEVNARVSLFAKLFEQCALEMPEVTEIVPAYCSVTIYFDETKCNKDSIKSMAQAVLEKMDGAQNSSQNVLSKTVKIPVCYEDADFAPDLADVAKNADLTQDEVIKIHSEKEYLIYMLGFLPGFAYLGGLDKRLETPRLTTPRTKIHAGSVAIGGSQTGLYPVESPGGWRIIGRTPLKVFDPEREPAFLYSAGDKIKFEPITKEEFNAFNEEEWLIKNGFKNENTKKLQRFVCTGGIKILDGGMQTTVQDSGRKGFQKYGIGESGAMDKKSFMLANAFVGNKKDAACLETTLKGPEISFTTDCVFAITGAVFNAELDGRSVPMNCAIKANAGSVLKCRFAGGGLRSYIAFRGGVVVPLVFKSSSTNVKSRMGGYFGRKLTCGDEIAVGNNFINSKLKDDNLQTSDVAQENSTKDNLIQEPLEIEVVKGAQFEFFSEQSVNSFIQNIYTVSPESDRMGIRFMGESLNCGKTDIISDAIAFGSVQITSAGLPVVMAADRQTTGGYAKIAAVTKESMNKLAQAVPGTKVKFIFGGKK